MDLTPREDNRPPQDLETPRDVIRAVQGFPKMDALMKSYEKAKKEDPLRPPDIEKPI